MQYLKSVDMFRVVQDRDNHLTAPSLYGAVVSVLTFLLLVVLLQGEVRDYFHGYEQCSILSRPMVRSADPDYVETSLWFPKVPCEFLDVTLTTHGRRVDDFDFSLQTKLFRTRSDTTTVWEPYVVGEESTLPACGVEARSILGRGRLSLEVRIDMARAGYKPEMSIEHQILSLTAGKDRLEPGSISSITESTISPLKGLLQVPENKDPTVFHYYLQFIYTTVQLPKEKKKVGYQHTAVFTQQSAQGIQPGVFLSYDASGFSSNCHISYATPSHFFVHLCAVAGGVYTVASLLDMLIESLMKASRLKQRKLEHAQNTQSALNAS